MIRYLPLKGKLFIAFFAVGIIPFSAAVFFSLYTASRSLREAALERLVGLRETKRHRIESFFQERRSNLDILLKTVEKLNRAAFEKLTTVQENKKARIESYFEDVFTNLSVMAQSPLMGDALRSFEDLYVQNKRLNVDLYEFFEKDRYRDSLRTFMEKHGFADLYLVTLRGTVVYAVNREDALYTNLVTGERSGSALAGCYQEALEGRAVRDFGPDPADETKKAAFVGMQIRQFNRLAGVLVVKLRPDVTNAIVNRRQGMGETGETWLAGKWFGEITLRSNRTVGEGTIGDPIQTPDAAAAIAGKSGTAIRTVNEVLKLIRYDPLNIQGLRWAIITEVSLEETITADDDTESVDYFSNFIAQYGYYDLYLIHPEGTVFYTVMRQDDYGADLKNGPLADSGLGRLFTTVMETGAFGFTDFSPYRPSNDVPAAFLGQPVVYDENIQLVVAIQLTMYALNRVMLERDGLGKTGETYLVGTDGLLRSDSFRAPERYTVENAFQDPDTYRIQTSAFRKGLTGQVGVETGLNYLGDRVFTAYTPISVWGKRWVFIADIRTSEALSAVSRLRRTALVTAVFSLAGILLVAYLLSRTIVRPIRRVMRGLLAGGTDLAVAARETAANSQSQSEAAGEQAATVEETSAALEEMTAMSRQTSDLTAGAEKLMYENIEKSGQSLKALIRLTREMTQIEQDSGRMSEIIRSIDEVAFQTNLLSLNAAVEAARAGEIGGGFTVVAGEVRNLAGQAAKAAGNTQKLLDETIQRVSDAAAAIKAVNLDFEGIIESATVMGEKTAAITIASQELKKGIEQIAQGAVELDKTTQQVAAGAEESAAAAEALTARSQEIKRYVDILSALIDGGRIEKKSKKKKSGKSKRSAKPSSR
jgi:methyl-accepting chemotaxis protein